MGVLAIRLVCAAVLLATMPSVALSADIGRMTGLPIPRFVSIAADVANLRLGPRRSYDVIAVYRRRGLPLQIIGEFDNWREVVDHEGDRGWMHTSLLSGRRTVMVDADSLILRRAPGREAPAMAAVRRGVVADLLRCEAQARWCFVEVDGRRGWLARQGLWGVNTEAASTS